jgi:hypothetical protein
MNWFDDYVETPQNLRTNSTFTMPAPARIAVSSDVAVGAGQLRVIVGSRTYATPALTANQIWRLDWVERGQEISVECDVTLASPILHILDEWQNARDVAQIMAIFDYDLTDPATYVPATGGVTYTRSTIAYDFGANGDLTQFAINAPLLPYDVNSSLPLGLRVEKTRTNSVRNNTMVGAAAGTPGTNPTNWSVQNATLSKQIVGTGTEDGIEYVDIRFFGTASADGQMYVSPEPTTQIAATSGQTWTSSLYCRLVGGSFANITNSNLQHTHDGRNSGGSAVDGLSSTFVPTSAALKTQRFSQSVTFSVGTVAAASPAIRFHFLNGAAIDITLRIGLWQEELGEDATSPIKTLGAAAVTRGTAQALITAKKSLFDAETWIVEGRAPAGLPLATTAFLSMLGPGGDDAKSLTYTTTGNVGVFSTDLALGTQANTSIGTPGLNTDVKVAARFSQDYVAGSMSGAAVAKDTSAIVPNEDMTSILIGRYSSLSTRQLNGTVKSIQFISAAKTDAELVTLATPVQNFWNFVAGTHPGLTFARSTVGWVFDSTLALVEKAINVARFPYNVVTGLPQGILLETTKTNHLRNNTAVGTVAGTPGTTPTNWAVTSTISGVTRQVIGTGQEDGIDYIDIRYSGTPLSSFALSIAFEANTQVVASVGQIWAGSVYWRLVGGDMTNISAVGDHRVALYERDSGGVATVTNQNTSLPAPTTAPLKTQRVSLISTLSGATTGVVNLGTRHNVVIGLAIDFTIRIGLPQLETNLVSSPIKTSTASVARTAELAQFDVPSLFTSNKVVIVEGRTPPQLPAGNTGIITAWDGTSNNTFAIRYGNTGNIVALVTLGGVTTVNMTLATVPVDTDFKIAMRFEDNNFSGSVNGAAVVTDTAGSMPTIDTVLFGRATTSTSQFNGPIKDVSLLPDASDADLVALSTI